MSNLSKILFLDIDGVLNSMDFLEKSWKANRDVKMSAFDRDVAQIDPIAVARLERILTLAPETEIVISSTWRRLHSLAEIRHFIGARGGVKASNVIISATGVHKSGHRGTEIDAWLHNFKPDNFCIVDDDGDMTDAQKLNHFVQTDPSIGLSEGNVLLCANILNGKLAS